MAGEQAVPAVVDLGDKVERQAGGQQEEADAQVSARERRQQKSRMSQAQDGDDQGQEDAGHSEDESVGPSGVVVARADEIVPGKGVCVEVAFVDLDFAPEHEETDEGRRDPPSEVSVSASAADHCPEAEDACKAEQRRLGDLDEPVFYLASDRKRRRSAGAQVANADDRGNGEPPGEDTERDQPSRRPAARGECCGQATLEKSVVDGALPWVR